LDSLDVLDALDALDAFDDDNEESEDDDEDSSTTIDGARRRRFSLFIDKLFFFLLNEIDHYDHLMMLNIQVLLINFEYVDD